MSGEEEEEDDDILLIENSKGRIRLHLLCLHLNETTTTPRTPSVAAAAAKTTTEEAGGKESIVKTHYFYMGRYRTAGSSLPTLINHDFLQSIIMTTTSLLHNDSSNKVAGGDNIDNKNNNNLIHFLSRLHDRVVATAIPAARGVAAASSSSSSSDNIEQDNYVASSTTTTIPSNVIPSFTMESFGQGRKSNDGGDDDASVLSTNSILSQALHDDDDTIEETKQNASSTNSSSGDGGCGGGSCGDGAAEENPMVFQQRLHEVVITKFHDLRAQYEASKQCTKRLLWNPIDFNDTYINVLSNTRQVIISGENIDLLPSLTLFRVLRQHLIDGWAYDTTKFSVPKIVHTNLTPQMYTDLEFLYYVLSGGGLLFYRKSDGKKMVDGGNHTTTIPLTFFLFQKDVTVYIQNSMKSKNKKKKSKNCNSKITLVDNSNSTGRNSNSMTTESTALPSSKKKRKSIMPRRKTNKILRQQQQQEAPSASSSLMPLQQPQPRRGEVDDNRNDESVDTRSGTIDDQKLQQHQPQHHVDNTNSNEIDDLSLGKIENQQHLVTAVTTTCSAGTKRHSTSSSSRVPISNVATACSTSAGGNTSKMRRTDVRPLRYRESVNNDNDDDGGSNSIDSDSGSNNDHGHDLGRSWGTTTGCIIS